jgi:hypothetical protein
MSKIQTWYFIDPLYGQPKTGGLTQNPEVAERASRNGHRVKAKTNRVQ